MHKTLKGFTLIELIVVIGIIAILGAITIVAVNPARQFSQARNAVRQSDTLAILNAVHQYAADNNGSFPATVAGLTADAAAEEICDSTKVTACPTGGIALNAVLSPVAYISALPRDPQQTATTAQDTKYTIARSAANVITVCAPNALTDTVVKTICATR
ncbi:MAG TPA: prepilin-type N-terminal cleavage/methylation domain-containing protein [Patescibacteria group bacterium]